MLAVVMLLNITAVLFLWGLYYSIKRNTHRWVKISKGVHITLAEMIVGHGCTAVIAFFCWKHILLTIDYTTGFISALS